MEKAQKKGHEAAIAGLRRWQAFVALIIKVYVYLHRSSVEKSRYFIE
jgi:hypothetical protein